MTLTRALSAADSSPADRATPLVSRIDWNDSRGRAHDLLLGGTTDGDSTHVLASLTVHTDDAIDQLDGENGQDGFICDPTAPAAETLKNRRSHERLNNL